MSGLIALFDTSGAASPLAPMIAAFPTRTGHRQWNDPLCHVAWFQSDREPGPSAIETQGARLFLDGEILGLDEPSADHPTAPAIRNALESALERPERFARLNGSFALVAYDPERRRLTLVTDRLASHPLYYFVTGTGIAVSTQIAALTAHPACPKSLDLDTLHQVIAHERVIGRGTIYRGIHRVEPGSCLTFENGRLHQERYWKMRWRRPDFPAAEAGDVLAERIASAMRRATAGTDRVGLLLSGGLDSRGLLGASPRPLTCFTQSAYRNAQAEVAERAARIHGSEFHFLEIEPTDHLLEFDFNVRLTGAMQRAQAAHFMRALPVLADNCDAIISGFGFDSLYRGKYLPARTMKVFGRKVPLQSLAPVDPAELVRQVSRSLTPSVPRDAVRRILAEPHRRIHDQVIENAVHDVLSDFLDDNDGDLHNAWDYLLIRSIGQHHTFANILCLRSGMRERVVAFDRDLIDTFLSMPPSWRYPDVIYRTALRRLLKGDLARLPYADTGLPPLLDPRLAFVLRSGQRLLRSVGLMKRPTVPNRFARAGSWPNFAAITRHFPPVADRVRALPDSEALLATGLFDRAGLRGLIDSHMSGAEDQYHLVMMLMAIDSWIRQFGMDAAPQRHQSELVGR